MAVPPSTVAVPSRVLRRGLCVLVALASALLCGLILSSMQTSMSMPMSDEMRMSAASGTIAASATGPAGLASVMSGMPGDTPAEVAADSGMAGVMPFMCGGSCADEAAAATCTVVATLSAAGLLLLLLLHRRGPLGLASRHPSSTVRRDWREVWRLPTLSLTDMCVLRV
ncbi:MAG: hypothetical protein JWN84_638 [Nocardioides sp.]|nr:hypothetical protein [Nocardioides sp.]